MHEVPAHAIEVRAADQLGPAILEPGVNLLGCGQQFLAPSAFPRKRPEPSQSTYRPAEVSYVPAQVPA